MPFERLDFTHFLPDVPDFLHGPHGLNLALNAAPLHQNWRELREPLLIGTTGRDEQPVNNFDIDEGGAALEVVEGIPNDLVGIYWHSFDDADFNETALLHMNFSGTITEVSRAAGYASVDGFRFVQYGSSKIIGSSIEYPLQIRTGAGAFADVSYSSTAQPQFEFIGRVRSRLVGAYAKDGATYYPHRFWWSAADDETEWDAVSGGPGFADIKTDAGLITGLVCFEEFAILFQENAVHRLTFVGGSTGFQRQQIGSAGDGKDFFMEPATSGRDVYYYSREGFKVVRNGSSIETITGDMTSRFFTDLDKEYARDPQKSMSAATSRHWGVIAFFYESNSSKSKDVALYNIDAQRWGVVRLTDAIWHPNLRPGGGSVLAQRDGLKICSYNPPGTSQNPLSPLDDLVFRIIGRYTGIGTRYVEGWQQFAPDTTDESHVIQFVSRVYEVPDAIRATIRRIRPVWRYNGTLANEPVITITIDYDESPHLNSAAKAQWSETTAAANTDAAGFVKTNMPIKGRYFQFTVDIASMPNVTIEEFDGLEFEIDFGGRAG